MNPLGWIWSLLFGSPGGGISGAIERAYTAKINATTDQARIDADKDLARLEVAARMAEAANADRWSATSIGRYLIVVPFGVWWAAIYVDSIINASWDVLAIPPAIMDMAKILVPAIVIADAGALTAKRLRR